MSLYDVSEKTALVVDTGWYVEVATRLAVDFADVLYWSPWQGDFPYAQDAAVGSGLEGVTRLRDLYQGLAMADVVVFPAEGFEGLQGALRQQGVPVWGSQQGTRMEEDRVMLKQYLAQQGLDTIEYETFVGVGALQAHLQNPKYEGWFVKLSRGFRGDMETCECKGWERNRIWYYDVCRRLGPVGDRTIFIIEPPVEGFEGGADTYCIDGEYPAEVMIGYEIKDSCYVSTIKRYNSLSRHLAEGFDALRDWFRRVGYRNLVSTEVRIVGNRAYLIDLAARFPWPPAGTEMTNITNFSEVVYAGANGELLEPEFGARFAVELNLSSPWLGQEWLCLDIPDEIRPYTMLHGVVKVGDKYWLRPQATHGETGYVGTVIAMGDDFKATIKTCIKRAKEVKGLRVEFDEGDIMKAEKTIAEGEESGIKFF